jgi:polysaccharide pyruvyl transferase WcaK-like protein
VAAGKTSIRILVEPFGDHSLNLGDVAMRQVAAKRLRELWPDAEISLLTKNAHDLPASLAAEVTPFDVGAQRAWGHEALPAGALSRLPDGVATRLRAAERELRVRWPRGAMRVVAAKRRLLGQQVGNASEFVDAALSADLVLVSGAGAINDHFGPRLGSAFDLLALAAAHQIPTVMMGQGIGPLHDGRTEELARRVLPRVDLIGLRERRSGLPILTRLGVPPERIVTTGDDAVELAYELRPPELGTALGLNVRRAGYVQLDDGDLGDVAAAIKAFLSVYEAELVSVPTSRHPTEGDFELVEAVAKTAGASLREQHQLLTPEDAVRQIGRCRVLVTGSYHAAVFALAQGVSAVCLAPNEYYEQKFLGLADLFGDACGVVRRDSDGRMSDLSSPLARAWETADEKRESLLAAAQEQVRSGRDAYTRIRHLVEGRR